MKIQHIPQKSFGQIPLSNNALYLAVGKYYTVVNFVLHPSAKNTYKQRS